MKFQVVAHVVQKPFNEGVGWDAFEWDGHKAFVTPAAWHRFFTFVGQYLDITLMSDDWSLDYQTAKEIAIEIWQGKRSYYSLPLNEDNPIWTRHW